jgi:TolB protein
MVSGVPDAEIWVVATDRSGLTLQLAAAGGLADTWVKWDPTSYLDQGRTLFWLTWSSRRAYGLRYGRDAKVQLWMTAFDPAAARAGAEPSSPAFRLPFQDIESGNHVAQWVTRVERMGCTEDTQCGVGEFCSGGVCTPDFI